MSEMYQRLAHSSWDCKYHVVFVPKRRSKVLFGQARRKLGKVFHAAVPQKECQIIEDTCCRTMCTCVSRFPLRVSGGLSDRISEKRETPCHSFGNTDAPHWSAGPTPAFRTIQVS
jgi:hypothetical protein